MRKSAFCICENKGVDQLYGNPQLFSAFVFCYIDSTIPLLPKSENLSSVFVQPGFCVGPGLRPQRQVFS